MATKRKTQAHREDAIAELAFRLGFFEASREDEFRIDIPALTLAAVDALEGSVGFKVFSEELAGYETTLDLIGYAIMDFISMLKRAPERDEMIHIVENSIDYF